MESQRYVSEGKRRSSPPDIPQQSTIPVQQEFLFVDAGEASSSRQGRRLARSFVMQKAKRERPWSMSKHTVKQRKASEMTSPAATGTPVKNKLCLECQASYCQPGQQLCLRCLQSLRPVPSEEIDSSLFDPFKIIPVEMNRQVSGLLEHFVTHMEPVAIAIDIRQKSDLMKSQWFDMAMSNAGFMHSLLCTAALHQYCFGMGSIETILYHRAQSIAAVNSAISDPNIDIGLSDANIGAAFNLLSVEEALSYPNFDRERGEPDTPDQRGVHLQGLRTMIRLRGGLTAIVSNRILQAFIFWHSTLHAIASFGNLYLSTDDLIKISFKPHPPGTRPKISQLLLLYCNHAQVGEPLTLLVESVLNLVADLNTFFGDQNSLLDPLDLQNYACGLECLLLQRFYDQHSLNPLEDSLCLALLIFTFRTTEAFRGRTDRHPLHLTASKKLVSALSATSYSEGRSCPELLLWILTIGAISAEGSTDSSWFVYQISLACIEFGIQDAEALLDWLHLCGWVSFKLDEAVSHLWQSIIDIRLKPYSNQSSNVIGPLQHQVASADFTNWQIIDSSILSRPSIQRVSPTEFPVFPVVGANHFLYGESDDAIQVQSEVVQTSSEHSVSSRSEGRHWDVAKSSPLTSQTGDTTCLMQSEGSPSTEHSMPLLQSLGRDTRNSIVIQREIKERKYSFLLGLPLLIEMVLQRFPLLASEPPMPEGKVRARWKCRCGADLFDDFTELEPGSVKELERQLREQDNNVNMTRNIGRTISEGLRALWNPIEHRLQNHLPSASNSGDVLPLEEPGQRSHVTPQSNSIQKPNPNSVRCQDSLHLLLCIDKGAYGIPLHQEHLEEISTDRKLFLLLRDEYFSRWNVRQWCTLKTIRSLSLSRFALDVSNFVEVHKHVSICGPACVCLPPVDRLDREYRCHPAPETKPRYEPAIGSQRLTHYFLSPQCVDASQKTILTQLPKRVGHLKASNDQEEIGWGIYFQESWHLRSVYFLVVLVAAFSLSFGIVWSITRRDIQGAFAVSSFCLTLGSLLLGYLVVKGA